MTNFDGSNFKLSDKITRRLKSKEELRAWLTEIDNSEATSKIELMRSTFYLADFRSFWECDPASQEYRDLVFAQFEDIAGRAYDVEFEHVASGRNLAAPYPYSTRMAKPISENLIGIASLMNALPVAPPSKLIDFGCGWANTSLTLARSGYDVTCIDIDPTCGDIVDYWKPRLLVEDNIRFVASNFDDVADAIDPKIKFDCAVFFKAFHHSANPVKLLETCHEILTDGGFIVLASEPITPNFYVPWGIRCDGTSAYAIAKHGWLELGFDKGYFLELAERVGFTLHSEYSSLQHPTMNGFVLQKHKA